MSGMRTNNRQAGFISPTLISLLCVSVALVVVAGLAVWAFLGRQDYKNNSDQKVSAAVVVAQNQTKADDAVQYAAEAKNPLKSHVGPAAYGNVTVVYPKNWSGYIVERNTNTSTPVDDYFQPDVVPDVTSIENAFALRVQVVQQTYDKVVASHDGTIKNNKATAKPYALPKLPNIVGTRIEGQLNDKKTGTLIILPVRNLTLQIWTEADQYKADFNNIILPNLTFAP